MARIEGVKREAVERDVALVLNAQERKWGAPLVNHLLYARRPSIFRGVRAMWTGLDQSGLLDPGLAALVNVRVAFHNRCGFGAVSAGLQSGRDDDDHPIPDPHSPAASNR